MGLPAIVLLEGKTVVSSRNAGGCSKRALG